jgi:class 3 adenylate cyclase
MEILFVDNKSDEFDSFLELPFAEQYRDKVEHRKSPVGLARVVEENPELRLIILDMLWESDKVQDALELGADAMRDLSQHAPEVPVIIYSILDDEETLRRLIPEMMRLGAYDWISKDESLIVRSFKFEQAYKFGRDKLKLPMSRSVLPPPQERRSNVHVAVIFCDMSGFTALSNEVKSDDLVDVLREFYSVVGSAIQEHGGYIDKYIGDEVMAVFGAMGPGHDALFTHVQECLAAARLIMSASGPFRLKKVEPMLRKSNLRWTEDKLVTIGQFRIGIESGEVEVVRFPRGNEAEITFIGTPVNLASRILNQGAPGEVWIGENAKGAGSGANLIAESQETEYRNLPGKFTRYRIRI